MAEQRRPYRADPHREVRNNHYLHWAAMLLAAAYMWQLHGMLAAIGLLIGLQAAIITTNLLIMALGGGFVAIRWSRWGWVILAYVLTGLSGATIGHVQ